jgi:spermidine synthase
MIATRRLLSSDWRLAQTGYSPPVLEMIAYDEGPHGQVALRRRTSEEGADVYELIVNGTFVMDTVETSTERLLASEALRRLHAGDQLVVVVAGLGLGFTARAVLSDQRVRSVEVVELDRVVVDWVRAGLVPETRGVLDDPRVRVHVADVRSFVRTRQDASVDAVLLDVDNGPDFLVHAVNQEVYERPFLAECARTLRSGGVLGVWSADRSEVLRETLTDVFGACEELSRTVRREGRVWDYYLYLATRTREPGDGVCPGPGAR